MRPINGRQIGNVGYAQATRHRTPPSTNGAAGRDQVVIGTFVE
jgi:hypothetical protein